ncbi:piggyBac transposable element-derived protein 4-like [Photinus pyralis]|nr:piggyBac transposable element-derived protein 4-like [Photinus pyralis]
MDADQNRPLSDKELREIVANLANNISDSDHESELDIEDSTDEESNHESIASEEDDLQSESENEESDALLIEEESEIFTAKDATVWSSSPLPTGRVRSTNILKGAVNKVILPPGKILEEPLDSFLLYMDDSIIADIVRFTNKEGNRVRESKPNLKWKDCDIIEMKAFFGLLITAGHLKQNHTSYEVLWSALYGPPIFRATMGLSRFKSIMRFMRFDDKESRNERRKRDKFAPFREIWNRLNKNFGKYYMPGKNLTVDEQLIPFRGRCPFIQYMPAKPDKYGMKEKKETKERKG